MCYMKVNNLSFFYDVNKYIQLKCKKVSPFIFCNVIYEKLQQFNII